MIGVQNVVNSGTSGGPLISASDEPGSFMGICMCIIATVNHSNGR